MSGTHASERRTRWVVLITAAMMIAELVVGYWTGSLALTADGWHMGTHAGALGLAALAYWFARTRARAAQFPLGTGKVFALAAYTNAVALLIVAVWMAAEAIGRLLHPLDVKFAEALPVAVIGLIVNFVSFLLLLPSGDHSHEGHAHEGHAHDDHAHPHEHGHAHGHGHEHDLNLRAAILHVAADAFTSVLAIGALIGGRYLHMPRLDPLIALVGSVVILRWGLDLCRQSSRQLLDVCASPERVAAIRERIASLPGARAAEVRLWSIGGPKAACMVVIEDETPRALADYRDAILATGAIEHLTVEIAPPPSQSTASF
jgi:cation diffusion facilitator family transporter